MHSTWRRMQTAVPPWVPPLPVGDAAEAVNLSPAVDASAWTGLVAVGLGEQHDVRRARSQVSLRLCAPHGGIAECDVRRAPADRGPRHLRRSRQFRWVATCATGHCQSSPRPPCVPARPRSPWQEWPGGPPHRLSRGRRGMWPAIPHRRQPRPGASWACTHEIGPSRRSRGQACARRRCPCGTF